MAGNTILVVDDEQRMRKLVRDFLTKQNFRVLEAADGEEAVDVFMENKDIVLVILDVMMPKMNGWQGNLQGNPPVLQSAYYYADGTWRGK